MINSNNKRKTVLDFILMRSKTRTHHEHIQAILINIFGGIVRCDRVAQGVVDAYKNIGEIPVPIIVRLQGTNAEEAKTIIDNSGLNVHSAVLLKEAAQKVSEVLA